MEVNVLGPLEARHNDVSIVPSATKPRQVLSLLAMSAGQVVTVQTIIDELWGSDSAPRSAIQTVQTYILRLRRHIDDAGVADDGKKMLVTRPGGYILEIAPEDVDAYRFQALAVSGERALKSGDYQMASGLLSAALGTWRGPALVDVRVGEPLGIELERLSQSRLSVLESRIDADLGLGLHHQLLSELAELTARYPLHERLCEQYMTALYRCGCRWRALEIFQRLRHRLVEELGIEPSTRVQNLQRAVLNSDNVLENTVPYRASVPLGSG